VADDNYCRRLWGAILQVLQAGTSGAILLVEWGDFKALLPLGGGFNELEALKDGKQIGPVSALLLEDNGYAPSNPVEWIDNLSPEIVLLSVSSLDGGGTPSRETMEAVGVHPAADRSKRLDRAEHGRGADVGGGGTGCRGVISAQKRISAGDGERQSASVSLLPLCLSPFIATSLLLCKTMLLPPCC
jgi:hypothetical protein